MRKTQFIPSVNRINNYQDYNRFIDGKNFNNKYYMVRHGQSEANINGTLCNLLSSPAKLTEQGICEAKQVAEKLADLQFPKEKICIFSSSLIRATQTAERISQRLGVAYQVDAELRERCYGNWEGTKITPEKIKSISTRDLENPFHNYENIESLMEVTKRITTWIMNFDSSHIGFIVVIISHYNVITMAINAFERAWPGRELSIKHAEIYPIINQVCVVNYFEREQSKVSAAQLGVFSKKYCQPMNQIRQPSNVSTPSARPYFLQSRL